ncbi:MAG TPA: FecR family protein [Elusimicrobiales bacterium]|mgnify:CR=1 FL=1|nr:FecR family protein [Elusimicrobiales bacterium]
MRKQIISLSLFVLLPLAAGAAEVKILSLNGSVEARQSRDGQWVAAAQNMEVAEGGAVRTNADGAAVLLMPNKTKVWVKDSSTLEIEQRQTLASRLALVYGRIKLRVPHLMRKEKFEVRTPAAVCAVRGTELTLETTEEGKMNLQVLFGEVKLTYAIPPEKGRSEFNIPQGQGLAIDEKGKSSKPVLLTAATERAALENWDPGLAPEERQKGLQAKENDRAQIKEFAKVTNNAESTVKSFLNVVKESDLEAGRTMNDIHGNLVRVDQRMMRPDNKTIQFFNLVKRPDYAAYTNTNAMAAAHGFAYYGGAVTNRLDLMQMNVGFNKDLPQRIEEWPGFFNSNDVKADYMSTIMANKTDGNIFFVATGAKYDALTDEMKNNANVLFGFGSSEDGVIVSGVLTDDAGITAAQGLNKISKLEFADNGSSDGQLKYTNGNTSVIGGSAGGDVRWFQRANVASPTSYSYSSEDAGSDQIWNYSAELYHMGGVANTATNVWYTMESYVIGNGGGIKSKDDFTNSSSDPFTLLKNSGGEMIIAMKRDTGVAGDIYTNRIDNGSSGDRFSTKNIDIVFIPDLMVAAVQRMLPAITELGN